MSSTKKNLMSEDYDAIESALINRFKGRLHCRGGSKTNVDYYTIVYTIEGYPGVLFGQITGPSKNFASFKISKEGKFPRYTVTPCEGNEASLDKLVGQVKESMQKINKKVLSQQYSGPMNKENWKGVYLKRSRSAKIGKKGMENLDRAVRSGEIDEAFKQVCIEQGILIELVNLDN